MINTEIDRAIKLLDESPENNNQIAKAIGVHPTTISNYRTKTTKPSAPNARLLIEYLTKQKIGATQTDNSSINPTNTKTMDPLVMDYINTLKEQLAKKDEQINALIREFGQKGGDESLSRGVGAVKQKQDELTDKL